MMVFTKSKSIIKKKRRSKKKKNLSEEFKPIIQPNCFNGSSNWLQLQKICKMPDKKDKLENSTKHLKNNNSSADDRPDEKLFLQKDHGSDKIKSKSTYTSPGKILNDAKVKPKSSPYKKKPQSLAKTSAAFSNQENGGSQFSFNFKQKNSDVQEKSNIRNNIKITKVVAMDCEMVGTGPKGLDSVVARVSLVNSYGECIYDEFVKPKEKVTDYRTQVSGVRPSDLQDAKELFEVQKDVLSIISGRIVVGHALKHDFDVLFISHPRWKIRDTASYKPFRQFSNGATPSLKKLTSRILGCEIQGGEHSSVEDAQAAMLLYLRHKKEWEKHLQSTKKRKSSTAALTERTS